MAQISPRIAVKVTFAGAVAALAVATAAALSPAAQAADEEAGWSGVWQAAPSNASRGLSLTDVFDPSAHPKLVPRDSTVRVVLTPLGGGERVRVRLSNRFGASAVTFGRVTIARQGRGAALEPGSVRELTFGGDRGVRVPAGADVTSDRVAFAFAAFERLAVSVWVRDGGDRPTEHFMGRQTSYATLPGTGDAAGAVSPWSFGRRTTTRPYVTGMDGWTSFPRHAVVTLGDSITDGYQPDQTGLLEDRRSIGADVRYPDFLARRIRTAGLEASVLNAGIAGNRVLRDGAEGGIDPNFGPAALTRLDADALGQPGAGALVVMQGINDLGMPPYPSAAELIDGLRQVVARARANGMRVVLGTITPALGARSFLIDKQGSAAADAKRREVNAWIRTQRDADAVADFDAAVRDPMRPSRLDPRYDGGDHLHLNAQGNRALADAVPVAALAPNSGD